MSSLTIETFEKDNIIVEHFWDKYEPHYHVRVCVCWDNNDSYLTEKELTYDTRKQSHKSFLRQVRLIKNRQYN